MSALDLGQLCMSLARKCPVYRESCKSSPLRKLQGEVLRQTEGSNFSSVVEQ